MAKTISYTVSNKNNKPKAQPTAKPKPKTSSPADSYTKIKPMTSDAAKKAAEKQNLIAAQKAFTKKYAAKRADLGRNLRDYELSTLRINIEETYGVKLPK